MIGAYGAGTLFWNLEPYHRWLYALIGVTWAFHVTFTLWMIPKGQTDLSYYGTFFSLVVIYLMNLGILTVLLIIASPHVTWRAFGLEWLRNAQLCRVGIRHGPPRQGVFVKSLAALSEWILQAHPGKPRLVDREVPKFLLARAPSN